MLTEIRLDLIILSIHGKLRRNTRKTQVYTYIYMYNKCIYSCNNWRKYALCLYITKVLH